MHHDCAKLMLRCHYWWLVGEIGDLHNHLCDRHLSGNHGRIELANWREFWCCAIMIDRSLAFTQLWCIVDGWLYRNVCIPIMVSNIFKRNINYYKKYIYLLIVIKKVNEILKVIIILIIIITIIIIIIITIIIITIIIIIIISILIIIINNNNKIIK